MGKHGAADFASLSIGYRDIISSGECGETLKISPYLYHDNMYFKCSGRKTMSVGVLGTLLKDNIPSVYYDILCMIGEYRYLNAYLIRRRISYLTGRNLMNKDNMRHILNEMLQKGLLLRYEMFHKDENGKEQGSPFIYELSPLGIRFIKKSRPYRFVNHEVSTAVFSCEEALRILAENQFSILLEEQYEPAGLIRYCDFSDFAYRKAGIRMLYGLTLPDGGVLALFAFAVRHDNEGIPRFLGQLRSLLSYMQYERINAASILVIVESEWLAMSCERARCCEKELKGLDVFYATDTTFLSEEDVFARLIEVLPGQDYSKRSIFRLRLKQENVPDQKAGE